MLFSHRVSLFPYIPPSGAQIILGDARGTIQEIPSQEQEAQVGKHTSWGRHLRTIKQRLRVIREKKIIKKNGCGNRTPWYLSK